jgi:hypothetical protein
MQTNTQSNSPTRPEEPLGDLGHGRKTPENRAHVESRVPPDDPRLRPGGAHGAPVSVGMESLDSDIVRVSR